MAIIRGTTSGKIHNGLSIKKATARDKMQAPVYESNIAKDTSFNGTRS